jgi:hypothetical protein
MQRFTQVRSLPKRERPSHVCLISIDDDDYKGALMAMVAFLRKIASSPLRHPLLAFI